MAHIILGVSSSISIYKSLDLVSRLKKRGHTVTPVLTRHAAKLINPGLFAALAGEGVDLDMFKAARRGSMEHITLARRADLIAVVPATAQTLARLALGFADDLLGTLVLASHCPLLVAPAMNPTMYGQAVVQGHLATLKSRGAHVVEPDSGVVACGDYGPGKLAAVERVEEAIQALLQQFTAPNERPSPQPLFKDLHAVITAGGSVEPLDPVRAITNGSSGKMALALAREMLRAGARVTYLFGQIKTPLPEGAQCVPFTTTAHLGELLTELMPSAGVLIMAAAPGDFRVKEISPEKMHRDGEKTITLVPNPDLLASLKKKPDQIFLGFAAESSDLLENAANKLKRKNLDLIVANQAVGAANGHAVGIGAVHTHFAILGRQGTLSPLQTMSKEEAATRILDALAGILAAGKKPGIAR